MIPDPLGPYRHTSRRLRERYGLDLTLEGYLALCAEVSAAFPDLDPDPCGDGRYRLALPVQGRPIRFVFEPGAGLIITALCPRNQASPPRTKIQMQGTKRRKRSGPQPYKRPQSLDWGEED